MTQHMPIPQTETRAETRADDTLAAWSVTRYGGPERLAPVRRPLPSPGPGQVLIRVRASAVTRADGMMRAGEPRFARLFLGLRRPRHDLIGTCLSGEVVATGPGVTRFAPGDEVFGMSGMNFGANASHIVMEADGVLLKKPARLSFEEAAVMGDGAITSYNFLHQVADLRAGERLLVIGASGSLGTAAVQIGAAMGAEVTGVCSAQNAGLVASLGAGRVIDYTREEVLDPGARYDVIYDTLGVLRFSRAKAGLSGQGRYVCPVLSGELLAATLLRRGRARFSATGILKPEAQRTMHKALLEMVEAGQFAPVMDRTYPLDHLIEAHAYVETGHKRGNVVVV